MGEAMREGPPPSPNRLSSPSSSPGRLFSTSTLIKEISTLRGRLRELEDDTRSTVSSVIVDDSPAMAMMRKELARVELEKANLEREFMNQMASLAAENAAKLEDLQQQLDEAEATNNDLNEKLIAAQQNDEAERYVCLLEEEREMHAKEIEQMKMNLASTDLEIAESRREMDHLHEQLYETNARKEALLDEITKLRLAISQEQDKSQSLESQLSEFELAVEKATKQLQEKDLIIKRKEQEVAEKVVEIRRKQEEVGEMNDAIIRLEEHKEMLVAEVTDVRMQLLKAEETNITLEKKLKSKAETPPESPVSFDERKQLEDSVTALEERLQRFSEKLKEKDKKIERIAAALSDERRSNKQLKKEIKEINGEKSKSIEGQVASDKRAGLESKDQSTEISFLRNQNKILNEEVKILRKQCNSFSINPINPGGSSSEVVVAPRAKSCSVKPGAHSPPSSSLSSPNLTRKAPSVTSRSPRAGISGIVASFERRIANAGPAADDDEKSEARQPETFQPETRTPETRTPELSESQQLKPIAELEERLRIETANLRCELEIEKATVAELKHKLDRESSEVTRLRSEEKATVAELKLKLSRESAEVIRIRAEEKAALAELREKLDRESAELTRIRAEENATLTDLREKLERESAEATRIRAELDAVTSRLSETRGDLETRLVESQEKAEKLLEKVQEHEKLKAELEANIKSEQQTAEALRAQVQISTMEHEELERKIADLETLKSQLEGKVAELEQRVAETETAKSKLTDSLELEQAETSNLRAKVEELDLQRAELAKKLEESEKETDKWSHEAILEIERLRNELQTSRQALMQEEKKEDEQQEELMRLREQVVSLQPELEKSLKEIETLQAQVTDLKRVTVQSDKDDKQIKELKSKIQELSIEKAGIELELSNRIRDLENEIEVVEVAAEEELEEKEKEIMSLQTRIEAQSKEIQRLEDERTQLCSSMNNVSSSRKDEIEELQDELMDMTAKAASKSREIEALKMKLEEKNRSNEMVAKLKSRVKELEEELKVVSWNMKNEIGPNDAELLKNENEKLRQCIREIKLERRTLQDRLDSLLNERSTSRSAQVLRERNMALKQEVEKLTKRLKKMEDSITRFAI